MPSNAPPSPLRRTPLRAFILGQCCNSQPGDKCLLCLPGCRVLHGRRCDWFERAVLPLAITMRPERFPGVSGAYVALCPGVQSRIRDFQPRPCPGCGQPLPRRKRVCDACRKKRRRESTRRAVAAHRVSRKQLTGESTIIS